MAKPIPWLRVLVEGATIVGSILLAFGIEAWWADRSAVDREQRLLVALSAEFEQNDELLQEARAAYERTYMDAVRILELVEGGAAEIDEAEFERLLRGLLWNRTFHLESGAHDALLASGDLDLIRDEELRNRLAAWPSYVAEWSEEERAVHSFVKDVLVPHVSGYTRLRSVARPFPPFPDGEAPSFRIPSGSSESASLSVLATSVEFDNLVYRRALGTWHAMRDGETLRAQLSRILSLIRRNVDQ